MFSGTAYAADPEFGGGISAPAWMLLDADSGRVLASSGNGDERIEPASTTKIMTLLVAVESGRLNDTVTLSSAAAGVGGSKCEGLRAGKEYNLKNLLTAMMMVSGNNAAIAVAEYVGGSEQGFVDMMNAKAKELGMDNTKFVTPHGMHKEDHFTTLNDMARLARAAIASSTFMDIVDRASYTMPENNVTYKNTNPALDSSSQYYYAYATGMKTGSTKQAGACLVASASHEGMNLICMFFGYPENKGDYRWLGAQQLFDFGFENYTTVDLTEVLGDMQPLQEMVENGSSADEKGGLLEFSLPSKGTYVTLARNTAKGLLDGTDSVKVDTVFTNGTPIQAPVQKDEVLGTVTYKVASTGEALYTGALVATRDVLQAGTESNVNGDTAVTKLPPMVPETISEKKDHAGVWLWLLVPAGLIAFLVFRLLTTNRKRRKRYAPRKKPLYSYKIRR